MGNTQWYTARILNATSRQQAMQRAEAASQMDPANASVYARVLARVLALKGLR